MEDRITITIIWHDYREPMSFTLKKSFIKILATIPFLVLLTIIGFKAWALWSLAEKWELLAQQEKLLQRIADLENERKRLEEKLVQMTASLKEEWKKLEEEKRKIEAERNKINELSRKLLDIQRYLSERGVKVRSTGAVGGGSVFKVAEMGDLETLNRLAEETYSSLRSLPIGYPVLGRITSTYGLRKNPFGSGYEFHAGIDIEAPQGTPVKVTADGIVVFADTYGNYGKTVIVKHASDYSTLYAHLSQIEVRVGQRVSAGQIIGRVGSTGRSTGPHLHYEIIINNRPIDPIKFLTWR